MSKPDMVYDGTKFVPLPLTIKQQCALAFATALIQSGEATGEYDRSILIRKSFTLAKLFLEEGEKK